MLAEDFDDAPPAVPLLEVLEGQAGGFVAPQPAADQHGEDGPVALALFRVKSRSGEQLLGFALGPRERR